MADTRGQGKLERLTGKDGEWQMWPRKFENYFAARHAGADLALEWAADQRDPTAEETIEERFGAKAGEVARITDVDSECCVLCLMQFMGGESVYVVSNVPRGRGLEASRRFSRRWGPATGGKRKNLLRAVFQPGRSSL